MPQHKTKPKRSIKKIVYDYKNEDIDKIRRFIKDYDFEGKVFSFPVKEQAEIFSKVLVDCFNEFVPKRIIHLKPQAIPWCNTYTRLLLRKKNRNYKFFKAVDIKYRLAVNDQNTSPQTLTQLLVKKQKAQTNFKTASRESLSANRRAKTPFITQ